MKFIISIMLAVLLALMPTFAVADDATLQSVKGAIISQIASVDASINEQIELCKGSSGSLVVQLQTRLAELGYYTIAIDGEYGNKTEKAIEAFQKVNGLAVDGIANAMCQAVLFSDNALNVDGHTLSETDSTIELIELFVELNAGMRVMSFTEADTLIANSGHEYESIQPTESKTGMHYVYSDTGERLYIMYYPVDMSNYDAFGDPDLNYISTIQLDRNGKYISVDDSYHISTIKYKTDGEEVSSFADILEYYESTMGGNVPELLRSNANTVNPDLEMNKQIETYIEARISEYYKAALTSVTINMDGGSSKPDGRIVLVYCEWTAKNYLDTTKEMLEMYSDDMAAALSEEYDNITSICIFWEVPYHVSKDIAAKYTYRCTSGYAYLTDVFGPLYFDGD